jgi:hypothetical protein
MQLDHLGGNWLRWAWARYRAFKVLLFTALGLLVLVNLLILPHHPHFGLEKIPGFWALFGVIGAIILARVCKGAAHTFLGKKEDYYDRP